MRTRTALLACLLGLPPTLAHAIGTVTVTETSDADLGGLSDEVINIAECDGTVSTDTVSLAWTYGAVPGPNTYYHLFAQTSSTCNLTETAGKFEITPVGGDPTGGTATGSLAFSLNVFTDLIEPLDLAGTCSASGATIYFCVVVVDGASSSTVVEAANATGGIRVDTTRPARPTSVSAQVGDGALTAAWVAGTGGATVASWVARANPVDPDATHTDCSAGGQAGARECPGVGATSCRITGLTNGACYDVTVQAISVIDNPSLASDPIPGSPRPVQDFWERYRAQGGLEEGGCGTGSATGLALLALAAVAPRLLRRRP